MRDLLGREQKKVGKASDGVGALTSVAGEGEGKGPGRKRP